jgi:hypothetical protein
LGSLIGRRRSRGNPFGFDDQLSDWVKDAQRSTSSPQAAAQPSSGDADPRPAGP